MSTALMSLSLPHHALRVSLHHVLKHPQISRYRPAQSFAPLVSCAIPAFAAFHLPSSSVRPSAPEPATERSPISHYSRSVHCSAIRTDTEQETADTETPYEGPMQAVVLGALEKALGSSLSRGPQAPAPQPLLVVISGPSGVGKDAVIKRLQEVRPDLDFVVTATTRAQRPGEVQGKDYWFVNTDEFKDLIADEELLEHAVVYGDYKGIPKQHVREALAKGTDVILRVDVQGAATVRSMLGQNAVFIFIVAESEVALVKRLVERKTESMEKILLRIATAREEIKRQNEFDYVIVNRHGHVEEAVQGISSIIDAEKSRVSQRVAKL